MPRSNDATCAFTDLTYGEFKALAAKQGRNPRMKCRCNMPMCDTEYIICWGPDIPAYLRTYNPNGGISDSRRACGMSREHVEAQQHIRHWLDAGRQLHINVQCKSCDTPVRRTVSMDVDLEICQLERRFTHEGTIRSADVGIVSLSQRQTPRVIIEIFHTSATAEINRPALTEWYEIRAQQILDAIERTTDETNVLTLDCNRALRILCSGCENEAMYLPGCIDEMAKLGGAGRPVLALADGHCVFCDRRPLHSDSRFPPFLVCRAHAKDVIRKIRACGRVDMCNAKQLHRRRCRVEAERVEAERVEAERVESKRIESDRIKAIQLEADRAEAQRIAEARIEYDRFRAAQLEAGRAEAQRVASERVEAERVEAERLEVERLEADRVEAERLEAERLEAERVECIWAEENAARAVRGEATRQKIHKRRAASRNATAKKQRMKSNQRVIEDASLKKSRAAKTIRLSVADINAIVRYGPLRTE